MVETPTDKLGGAGKVVVAEETYVGQKRCRK